MRFKILIAWSLVLELGSWAALLSPESPGLRAAMFFASHAAASGLLAAGLSGLMPSADPRDRRYAVVVFAVCGFCLPIVGVPGLVLNAWPALAPRRQGVTRVFTSTAIPGLPSTASTAARAAVLPEVDPAAALRPGNEPAVRLQAVVATGRLRGPAAVSLLSTALRDPDDEVRLLAYALLDGKEREIYTRIKQDTERLEVAPGDARAQVHARLAHHHWELVYLGLAQGEVASHELGKAREHAEAALAERPGDAGTLLLLGRVSLREGRLELARRALERALGCGLPEDVVGPYLAEEAFRGRRFEEVRALARRWTGGALARLADYWT